MSAAREIFLRDVRELRAAISLPSLTEASSASSQPGVGVLRRGAAITGLVMLETFVRDRTNEILDELRSWPAHYEDFPARFRRRATIDALGHLEKYARMLKRQGGDFEQEIIEQASLIASMSPPAFRFTKHIAGDYTGNLSARGAEELLRVFQVKDCWKSMHLLSTDVGFGVPSVHEVLKSVVRNRHQSAHSPGYSPAAQDVLQLPENLRLVAICVDAAISASVRVALHRPQIWNSSDFDWRSTLEIFFLIPSGSKFRLIRRGARKATRILNSTVSARTSLPRKAPTITRLLVEQGPDQRPVAWDIA